MLKLKERIDKELRHIQSRLGCENVWAVPRLDKVTVNAGLGRTLAASAKTEDVLKKISSELAAITGQKPVETRAKKAIASFKTREGMTIGLKVTLHGSKAYDFLDRFVKMALPRTRDFRGLKESCVDENGNLNVGVKDHTIFPEASADAAHTFGFEFTAALNGSDHKHGLEFFRSLGFPFEGLPRERQRLAGKPHPLTQNTQT